MVTARDTSFDSIKYVLIAFVVFGHTFQLGMEGLNEKLFSFINSFHMPAFIIISGYFYKDNDCKKFWRSNLELLLTILIFQILLFSNGEGWKDPIDISFNGIINSIAHIYEPKGAMWYLLSLVLWRMMMRITPPLLRNNMLIMLLLAIFVSLLAGFVPLGTEFSFQRTSFFFPFFLLGYYIKQKDFWQKIRSVRKWSCLCVIGLYFVIICLIPNYPDSMLTGSFHYFSGLTSWKLMPVIRVCGYIWMLPLALCVLNVIPDTNFLAVKGKDTLFYLLYHPFFIKLMYAGVKYWHIPTNAFFLLLYTLASMFIMFYLAKIPFLYYLTKPLSYKRMKT